MIEYRDPPGYRTVLPHACGLTRRGKECVRVYQRSGPSKSGKGEHWKMMTLESIVDLEFAGGSFATPAPGYKPGDRDMIEIYADYAENT
ncbi:MAG: hypothetical protein F4057_03865 [Acidobacteria bacterium]|nr:hypothetical protein [Acidobacteriota bacterium]